MVRYPGSKAKLYRTIHSVLPEEVRRELFSGTYTCYCEAFVGTGAIGWNVLKCLEEHAANRLKVIINDLDPYICRLWQVVLEKPAALCRIIMDNEPTKDDFVRYKELDGLQSVDPVVCAYRKLVVHNTSWSGLGVMAGGVLGGRDQRSGYSHLSRWKPERICRDIRRIHGIMRACPHLQILNLDFLPVLESLDSGAVVYLDPPYYGQGQHLYKYNFDETDHVRLANCLRRLSCKVILSYDDDPRIRLLYSWARILKFDMTPSVATKHGRRNKNDELLITTF